MTSQPEPPRPYEDAGVLYVHFVIEAAPRFVLLRFCRAVNEISEPLASLSLEPDLRSFSALRVTAGLFLSPSTTATIATEVTVRMRESCARHYKPAQITRWQAVWVPSLKLFEGRQVSA